jgi:ferredoxin-NADP reductase
MSLPNFKYEVCLSRLEPTLKAQSGRLTGEFVSQHVIDLVSPTFFLCGPSGFTDNARQILSTLGVDPDRILQESFGETKRSTESRPREARPAETVVFIHSQKVSQASAGSTLLDLAEKNGVQIP